MATDLPGVNRYGVTGTKEYNQFDRSEKRKQLNALLAQGSGVNQGSAALGFAIGTGLRKALGAAGVGQTKDYKQAQQMDEAIKATRSQLAELAEGRETDPFKAAIQERKLLVQNLEAQGNFSAADTVRGQMLTLLEQEEKFGKLQTEGDIKDQELEAAKAEHEAKMKEGYATQDFLKLTERAQTYDLTDPKQYAAWEQTQKQIEKRNTIVGRTESDLGPKDKRFKVLSEKHIGLSEVAGRLDLMAETYNPEYQRLEGKMKGNWLKVKDFLHKDLLSPEEKQYLADYTQHKQNTINNLNEYIKMMTGAQMSEKEAQRLTKVVPNADDSPAEYEAKLKQMDLVIDAQQVRYSEAVMAETNEEYFEIMNRDISEYLDEDLFNAARDASVAPGGASPDEVSGALERARARRGN